MVDIENWMDELTDKVRAGFGGRLLFLGFQGSYGRGEATEDSDIDVVMVLDRLELDDLDRYRAMVAGMPEGEKACGFVCGAEELRHWPGYDLLQLVQDTRGFSGSLAELVPPMGRREPPERVFARLIRWSGAVMAEANEKIP